MAPLAGEAPPACIQGRLLSWYDVHHRHLPWRGSKDPYAIWVSEIMLQQTRVAVVIPYFERFMARFPGVRALAAAPEPQVLTLWSGLGYYRRARLLRAAAQIIVQQCAGEFPSAAAAWRQLPGIGRYTAAAIASIAFNQAVAVVDGNVRRVLCRLSGKDATGETGWRLAAQLLPPQRPGDFNQAMMELGATVCTPRSPHCLVCPLATLCVTKGEHAILSRAPRRRQTLHLALWQRRGGEVLLMQRGAAESLMPSMWDLPPHAAPGEQLPRFRLRHSITATDYDVMVFSPRGGRAGPRRQWFAPAALPLLPLTGLARKILRRAALLPL